MLAQAWAAEIGQGVGRRLMVEGDAEDGGRNEYKAVAVGGWNDVFRERGSCEVDDISEVAREVYTEGPEGLQAIAGWLDVRSWADCVLGESDWDQFETDGPDVFCNHTCFLGVPPITESTADDAYGGPPPAFVPNVNADDFPAVHGSLIFKPWPATPRHASWAGTATTRELAGAIRTIAGRVLHAQSAGFDDALAKRQDSLSNAASVDDMAKIRKAASAILAPSTLFARRRPLTDEIAPWLVRMCSDDEAKIPEVTEAACVDEEGDARRALRRSTRLTRASTRMPEKLRDYG
ncbi:hypothetical protein HK101_000335 [Irineochytrium annulatum]|nr:hypothetical protein HK101_000335 [Irineochytrium annulatum]